MSAAGERGGTLRCLVEQAGVWAEGRVREGRRTGFGRSVTRGRAARDWAGHWAERGRRACCACWANGDRSGRLDGPRAPTEERKRERKSWALARSREAFFSFFKAFFKKGFEDN